MPRRFPSYAPRTTRTVRILGMEIERARKQSRISRAELAERAGIALNTVGAVERGSTSVAIGTFFELANLVGLDIIAASADLDAREEAATNRLALLPGRIRERTVIDDDF